MSNIVIKLFVYNRDPLTDPVSRAGRAQPAAHAETHAETHGETHAATHGEEIHPSQTHGAEVHGEEIRPSQEHAEELPTSQVDQGEGQLEEYCRGQVDCNACMRERGLSEAACSKEPTPGFLGLKPPL